MCNSNFMDIAIEEANIGILHHDGGPFGAAIVKDGRVVGKGHNRVVVDNDPTSHGEINAIRDACSNLGTFDLSGCVLYTTSEPCPMCRCAIMWANIEHVYYGCTVYDAENIGFRDVAFETQAVNSTQIRRDDCLKLFEQYTSLNPTRY